MFESSQILLYVGIGLILLGLFLLKRYMSGARFDTSRYKLTGRHAVITGGNAGIGKETVFALAHLGCNIIIGARDREKSQKVIKEAKKRCKHTVTIEEFHLDLSSKESVQEFAQFVGETFPSLDYLINNAGLSLIPKKKVNGENLEIMYAVNHLGHFYLTQLLYPMLEKCSGKFRIVNVSSMAHLRVMGFLGKVDFDWDNMNFDKEGSYHPDLAYSRSKLYNVFFTKALASKIPSDKGTVVALHPGVVRTEITRSFKLLEYIILIVYPLFWLVTKSSFEGAQTTLFAVLSDKVENGEYYADCAKSRVNLLVNNSANWERLWQISERDLGIKFQIPNEL